MASFLPSSIQKRLLRYALLRTGLLEADDIDLESLDIQLGRQNTVELRDVGLHTQKLTSLLELPPEIRLETARVLRLKLNVPADLYNGSITAEADGIECGLAMKATKSKEETTRDERSGRSPTHRKTHRRIGRSPPYDPGGDFDDGTVPTTQDLARSFLMEEPREEITTLEERYERQRSTQMQESSVSDASSEGVLGTGNTPSLPGFLAGFLQGIVDRFQLTILDVTGKLVIPLEPTPGQAEARSITAILRVESIDLGGIGSDVGHPTKRHVSIENIRLYLDGLRATEGFPLQTSVATSEISVNSAAKSQADEGEDAMDMTESIYAPPSTTSPKDVQGPAMQMNQSFGQVGEVSSVRSDLADRQDPFEIRAGEDNLMWNLRRNESSSAASDIWSDSDQPADLTASVTADRYLSGSRLLDRPLSPESVTADRSSSLFSEYARQGRTQGYSSTSRLRTGEAITNSSQSAFGSLSTPNPTSREDSLKSKLSSSSEESLAIQAEDLAESRVYSGTEAESMFMSAYSTAPGVDARSPSPEVLDDVKVGSTEPPVLSPVGSTDTLPAIRTLPVLPGRPQELTTLAKSNLTESKGETGTKTPTDASGQAPDATPRLSSGFAHHSLDGSQLMLINKVDIYIQSGDTTENYDSQLPPGPKSTRSRRPSMATSQAPNMPGAFSVYAEQSASVRFDQPNAPRLDATNSSSGSQQSIQVNVQNVYFAAQIGMTSDYIAIGKSISKIMAPDDQQAVDQPQASPRPREHINVEIALKALDLKVVRSGREYWNVINAAPAHLNVTPSLIALTVRDVHLSIAPPEAPIDWSLRLGKLNMAIGDGELLHFSDRLQESRMSLYQGEADVFVEASTAIAAMSSTKVVQFSLQTKQINFALPLYDIEDAFSSYGGLSGLMELSSSIAASDANTRVSPTISRKGVRFEDSPVTKPASTNNKVNARIGGISAVVSGRMASVKLVTSAVKAVARSEYIAAAIDNVQVLGPQVKDDLTLKPAEVVLNSLRFEYLFHPKDADLERLLSLLTPSKNKYENDDDILIDTLLRQRRKGAVVRLSAAALRIRVHDWAFVGPMQAFADEMSSLAAVTKYLPEDERPGLLTLFRIQEVQGSFPINTTFGDLNVSLQDINVAQIGLPSLVAFSIGTVKAGRENSPYLLHDFMPVSSGEDLPMVMARMIGDEVEPTLRLKLFNLCVEYSVPAFLALTELGADVRAEQVIDLAASKVIDLAAAAEQNLASPSSLNSSSSKQGKKLSIDLLLHDCIVGLQPEGLTSKAHLVFKNAKMTTEVPPKEAMKAVIELRRSTVYVADEVTPLPSNSDLVKVALPVRLSSTFHDLGSVSICSIMTARIDLQITESLDGADRSVEVDVKNELFLIETCADSTQTLMKTLSALAPPLPPSKEDKFRVEAMTMDEMVASFTGDAFQKPASPPSTLFDMETTEPVMDDDDLMDTSMSESIYGGLGALEDPEDDLLLQGGDQGDTAESLLEEDPFEIPDNPNAAKLNNRDLMRTLNEQLVSNIEGGPVELKPLLLTDEQLDRLPGESTVLGAPHRWNTPRTNHPSMVTRSSRKPLPFKLRVREVHLIWNLYDGYDWHGTRQTITQAVEEVEQRAEERRARRKLALDPDDEESIIGDCLFNSIYIGVPANRDPNELRRQINRGIDDLASETESYATSGISKPTNFSGGSGQRSRKRPRRLKLERSKAHKIAFEAKGVCADVLVYPSGSGEAQSSVDLRVRDFEIFDNLPTSTWRKFMTSWHKDHEDREMAKPMVHLELTTVRPVPTLSATELILIVALTPIRLHVDQDALDFMTRFFEFKPASSLPSPPPSEEPFIQRIEVHTVQMCLDYKPKRVDYAGLRSGRYTEFKNFFILDAAQITLRHAILYGIKGFDPLHDTLNDIWTPDIKRNQLPGILSGLATVSPLVNLGTGFAEVVGVPIREYRKDGRVVRSIQKGAVHLMRNTTSEIARFGARVAVGTQNVLVGAETMLSPAQGGVGKRGSKAGQEGWTEVENEDRERVVSAYANQPLGVLQGLKSARRHLERDLLLARDAVIAVQGEVLDSGSASAAAQAVVRHAPTILLRPVIGASRAVGQTLMGAGNQFDRSHVRKIEDKYKQR
ncbi:Autophagy-related protein 2 [Sphaceloma murrayae]|uniref:Autophagy-related protein 2 n=1 Tax=Sphaceloma murrayae TaxID=2082308 RepID=A0A2K1QQI1_9PEZI|nr:Autophagy-related protein 2 [Sphaceloma murrayae]